MPAININRKNHKKEITRCKKPVLLSFSGRGLASLLVWEKADDLSRRFGGKIKVGVVDSTQNAELAKIYKIAVFPTTLLIKNNAVTDSIAGNLNDYLVESLLT